MSRSPEFEKGLLLKPGTPGSGASEPESAPECRRRCDVRLRECTLAGAAGKEDCRKAWRYCVYDCFCR